MRATTTIPSRDRVSKRAYLTLLGIWCISLLSSPTGASPLRSAGQGSQAGGAYTCCCGGACGVLVAVAAVEARMIGKNRNYIIPTTYLYKR